MNCPGSIVGRVHFVATATALAIRNFTRAAAMKKQIEDEYPEVKALLADMELTKR